MTWLKQQRSQKNIQEPYRSQFKSLICCDKIWTNSNYIVNLSRASWFSSLSTSSPISEPACFQPSEIELCVLAGISRGFWQERRVTRSLTTAQVLGMSVAKCRTSSLRYLQHKLDKTSDFHLLSSLYRIDKVETQIAWSCNCLSDVRAPRASEFSMSELPSLVENEGGGLTHPFAVQNLLHLYGYSFLEPKIKSNLRSI